MENDLEKKDETDEHSDYLGNIWGWKISYMSLALIVFMLVIMLSRKCYLAHVASPVEHKIEAQN